MGFLSAAVFAGILIYLLFCTIKGNFKMGIRVPGVFTLHPMKYFCKSRPNETFMNSFLFNVLLILICSISLT